MQIFRNFYLCVHNNFPAARNNARHEINDDICDEDNVDHAVNDEPGHLLPLGGGFSEVLSLSMLLFVN